MEPILSVRHLETTFTSDFGSGVVVDDVSFDVPTGQTLCIVGESGCGKSVTCLSIMGLLGRGGKVTGGQVVFDGRELTGLTERELDQVRGSKLSMIFQDALTSLNPVFTVGNQLTEGIRIHTKCSRQQARSRSIQLLSRVGLPDPEAVFRTYPHTLSGGQRQRVMIAMALGCDPKLLIADEPTTALDVTIQAQILNLIKRLNRELDMTTILITHDLGVVATLCDKVVVMYGGLIMEDGTVEEIFYHPKHPYTMGLIDSIPRVTGGEKQRLKPIPGTPPNLIHPPKGCPFSTRCPYCMNVCMEEMPPYFQEDGHRTMCWLLHEEAPVNPEYVQRKEAMRRADG